jgi:spermidine dehydrogenase
MDRPISRRDFLSGVGVAVSGSLLYPWAKVQGVPRTQFAPEKDAGYHPPALTGMRGSHEGSYEVAHELVRGKTWDDAADTGESYDLVVVGGGISGLATAYYFQRQVGRMARILILDNHDDFGGHAKRNEFHHNGRLLLMNGGTVYIEDFADYDGAAQGLLRELGLEIERFPEFANWDLYRSRKLGEGVFFGKETFGTDHLAVGKGELTWAEFLAKAPLTEAARKDIARLYEDRIDYLPDLSLEQKKARLQKMSYQDYLVTVAKADPSVLPYLQSRSGYWAIGNDALPAWVALRTAAWADWFSDFPGFQGLGFPVQGEKRQYFRFPDGNASIARLLVRAMVPRAAPGSGMEDIVTARFDYSKLDREDAPVRIRLNSTAVRVRHRGDPQTSKEVEITYVRGGEAHRVRASHAVLACYNSIIPHLCPELPERQRKALSNALKAPLVYTRVLIRNWEPLAKLRLQDVSCPGCYHHRVFLSDPISMGSYRCSGSPEEPMVLDLRRTPLSPGLPAAQQFKLGKYELLETSFETFERKIRDQLGRMLADGGFDPARDIEAITVNRWPHGYAYGYDPIEDEIAWLPDEWPEERRTWVVGRQRFGRISIANSDANANAMTEAALGAAHRAAKEVLGET